MYVLRLNIDGVSLQHYFYVTSHGPEIRVVTTRQNHKSDHKLHYD